MSNHPLSATPTARRDAEARNLNGSRNFCTLNAA
jgi:hypothetical protein